MIFTECKVCCPSEARGKKNIFDISLNLLRDRCSKCFFFSYVRRHSWEYHFSGTGIERRLMRSHCSFSQQAPAIPIRPSASLAYPGIESSVSISQVNIQFPARRSDNDRSNLRYRKRRRPGRVGIESPKTKQLVSLPFSHEETRSRICIIAQRECTASSAMNERDSEKVL